MIEPLTCPVCRARPVWHLAPRTSKVRGVNCAFFTGCDHVTDLIGGGVVEASGAASVITRWNVEAERLLATTTAHWTDSQRSEYRARLGWPAQVAENPASPLS